ncbi:MAG: PdxA family protein, partial [Bacteroidia bacterium]
MPNRRKPKHRKLRVGITIGDVSGIGPELIIQAFQDPALVDMCIPIVYGSSRVINIYRKVMGVEKFHYIMVQKPSQAQNRKLNVIDCVSDLERIDIGKPSEASGLVAYEAVKRAVEDAQHQELDAMITMPVDKASFQRHDERFTGHTELLAQAFNVQDNLMLMVSDELRVGLVTNHVAIQDVAQNISVDKIFRKGLMLDQTLRQDFGITQPRIAILGLNPHAGDSGLIGKEEEDVIAPAIRELKNKGVKVMGPYPADGFFGSLTYRKFDGILAMYHDQGLVPFKLIAG